MGRTRTLQPLRGIRSNRLKEILRGKKMALLTDELVEKAKAVKSAAELLALALENDFLMSEAEAEEYFAMLQMSAK